MSKNNKNKQTGQGVKVPSSKAPASPPTSGQGYSKRQPSWRFSRLKNFTGTEFGYEKLLELANDVLEKLIQFESMDWNQIANIDKENNHWCKIKEMAKVARDMITQNKLDYLDQLFSLHLTGKLRVWGFINQDGTFDIFWIDPGHDIYPSPLKHT